MATKRRFPKSLREQVFYRTICQCRELFTTICQLVNTRNFWKLCKIC